MNTLMVKCGFRGVVLWRLEANGSKIEILKVK